MGIQIEFNPDLALRTTGTSGRLEEECVPEELIVDEVYPFLKSGQRVYWLGGEIPLVTTEGGQKLSRPIASVTILEATHYVSGEKVYTRGFYRVNDVYADYEEEIHFEGMKKIK